MNKAIIAISTLFIVLIFIGNTANSEETPSFKYYTIYDNVLISAKNRTLKGRICASSSWSIKNSGQPDLFKDLSIAKMNAFDGIKESMTGVCDLVAVRWDIKKYRPQLKKALNWAPHKEIPILSN